MVFVINEDPIENSQTLMKLSYPIVSTKFLAVAIETSLKLWERPTGIDGLSANIHLIGVL